jgi:SAM-dependent methyltransferase
LELRDSFERAAAIYDEARPRYPEALFETLLQRTGLETPAEILEIGCGPGVASTPLAERGHRLTCLERGAELAARARENLGRFPGVSVVQASFEDWSPPRWGCFDLLFAATAWHWLDPSVRYARAQRLLRDSGWLAFWSATHVVPEDGDLFFAEIQPVYDAIGESLPSDSVLPRPGERPDAVREIAESRCFRVVSVDRFDWETTYDAPGYLALLDTFSGHIAMESSKRVRLYDEIRRRLAKRPDGKLRRHWEAVLHVAQRLPAAP